VSYPVAQVAVCAAGGPVTRGRREAESPGMTPSAAALDAWSKSFLSGQDPDVRDELLRESRVARYPSGATICRGEADDYKVALVHSGRIRGVISTYDGREATTRYFVAGDITGVPAMLTNIAPSYLAAVTSAEISILSPGTFRRLMRERADLSYEVAIYLAQSAYEVMMYLEDNMFGSVQQRVIRHLLDMAIPTANGLVVQTDQAELANAIGSVREVVARALKKLSDTGAIRRSRRQIWIEDPAQLRSFASVESKPTAPPPLGEPFGGISRP